MKEITTLLFFVFIIKSIMVENSQLVEVSQLNEVMPTKDLPIKNEEIKVTIDKKSNHCLSLSETRQNLYESLVTPIPRFPKRTINIAVIDTGLDFSIPAFKNKIYHPNHLDVDLPKNFYGFDVTAKNLQDAYNPKDTHGHGTHVSGIIIAMFPSAKILPIKAFNNNQKQSSNYLAKAIEIAIMADVDIINISSGGEYESLSELEAIKKAEKKGILVVAASGNNGKNLNYSKSKFYPASYQVDNIISVMSHDKNGDKLKSSNYGKKRTDIMALGIINSYSLSSDKNCQAVMTGTSQATPVVTATLAMIMSQNPDWDYKQVKEALLNSVDFDARYATLNKSSGKLNITNSLDNGSKRNIASVK